MVLNLIILQLCYIIYTKYKGGARTALEGMARVHLDRIPHTFFGGNIKRAVLNHVSVVCSRDTSDIRQKKIMLPLLPPNFFSRFTPPQFFFLILAQIHALYDADRSSTLFRVSSALFRVTSALFRVSSPLLRVGRGGVRPNSPP